MFLYIFLAYPICKSTRYADESVNFFLHYFFGYRDEGGFTSSNTKPHLSPFYKVYFIKSLLFISLN